MLLFKIRSQKTSVMFSTLLTRSINFNWAKFVQFLADYFPVDTVALLRLDNLDQKLSLLDLPRSIGDTGGRK
jgi:hypothetical protein